MFSAAPFFKKLDLFRKVVLGSVKSLRSREVSTGNPWNMKEFKTDASFVAFKVWFHTWERSAFWRHGGCCHRASMAQKQKTLLGPCWEIIRALLWRSTGLDVHPPLTLFWYLVGVLMTGVYVSVLQLCNLCVTVGVTEGSGHAWKSWLYHWVPGLGDSYLLFQRALEMPEMCPKLF